jgi:hypothetical protein
MMIMKKMQRMAGYGLAFLVLASFACNSPMKSKQQMDQQSGSSDNQSDNQEVGGTANGAAPLGGNAAVGAGGAGGQAAGTPGGPTPGSTGGASNVGSGTFRDANHKYAVMQKGDGEMRSLVFASMNLKGDTTKGIADSITVKDVKGTMEKTQLVDFNNDHNPDVLVFTRSTGDEAAGSVYGITYIGNKGVPILPGEVEQSNLPGYEGRDSFYVQQPYLIRSYPMFKKGDAPGAPTGGTQKVKYTLEKRAGGYMLKAVK